MEAIGAFFLVLVFGFTGDPIAIGLTLMALVYIGSRISGAHYNPAVSLAFFLRRQINAFELLIYILSQLLGAFLAAIAIYFLANSVFYIEPPSANVLYEQAFAEVLFTFVFVLVMLTTALTQPFRRTNISGLAIGLTFGGMLMVATPISGGILNPATFLGTAAFDLLRGGYSITHSLLYTLAPLAGGALAAFAFSYFHPQVEV
jgi:glycerol uptake facilitator-like aquaporin